METALATGTGVEVNALMARLYAREEPDGRGGFGFGAGRLGRVRPLFRVSASSPQAVEYGAVYGFVACCGCLCSFLEGMWTKIHQARGNMRRPWRHHRPDHRGSRHRGPALANGPPPSGKFGLI